MTPEEVRVFFANDHFANDCAGIDILEVSEGYAKTRLVVKDKHKNANNVVMGGCVYTLADYTFALAANCGDQRSMTLSCTPRQRRSRTVERSATTSSASPMRRTGPSLRWICWGSASSKEYFPRIIDRKCKIFVAKSLKFQIYTLFSCKL